MGGAWSMDGVVQSENDQVGRGRQLLCATLWGSSQASSQASLFSTNCTRPRHEMLCYCAIAHYISFLRSPRFRLSLWLSRFNGSLLNLLVVYILCSVRLIILSWSSLCCARFYEDHNCVCAVIWPFVTHCQIVFLLFPQLLSFFQIFFFLSFCPKALV